MKRPFPLRLLPPHLRQWLYFQRYHKRHRAWRDLFAAAELAACPSVTMHDLILGDEISGSIAFLGFYEWTLTQRIARHAADGGLFVDVGANMGYFALLWAGISASGKAIAFEPSARNVALLSENIRRNRFEDRITVIPKAAGDRNESVTFDTGPREQTGWGGIAAGLPENRIVVPMVRLDDELAGTEIDVLKVDTEGADALVLRGCERLLAERRIKVIYFEENVDKIQRIGLRPRQAHDLLRAMKYDCRPVAGSHTEWFAVPT